MGRRLEFGLLGPLLVRRDGTAIPVTAGRQRTLLAALLLNRGKTVPADELIEVLWGFAAPASARASLHNYVKRLRKALGDTGHSLILTRHRGYAISVDDDEYDVSRFEALLRAAREAVRAGAWDHAARETRAALSLWRGEPLADVESEALQCREIPRLAELRLHALEVRLDADLRVGRHADVIPELQRLASVHPLRERLHERLMLALYRSGRQAEALAVYRDARQVLIDELGIEPGPGLRELHRQILDADPALILPVSGRLTADRPGPVVPPALPGVVRHFVGRHAELAVLTGLAGGAAEHVPGIVVISVISGTAGVGKTALAVRWAHQAAEHFPDGRLYVNLRGYDPEPPVTPDDALAGLLRALGVPDQEIPAGPDERASRYRSLLADRRVLVLLDNARSAEQVRPLLPATVGCMALVTSRNSLAGLVARDGARRLELDVLPLAEATGLLRALIGQRAAGDPDAALALAEQCSRLPLALRVAAERAAARPVTALASLVAELADERSRLALLSAGGDQRTAVRTVFSWSYQQLDPAAARVFRLAALHPGPDLDSFATAVLTGATAAHSGVMLDLLTREHLMQLVHPGRYGMHDLLRAYARELAAAEDDEDERAAGPTRLFDHYLHAVASAMDGLVPPGGIVGRAAPAGSLPAPLRRSPTVPRGGLARCRAPRRCPRQARRRARFGPSAWRPLRAGLRTREPGTCL